MDTDRDRDRERKGDKASWLLLLHALVTLLRALTLPKNNRQCLRRQTERLAVEKFKSKSVVSVRSGKAAVDNSVHGDTDVGSWAGCCAVKEGEAQTGTGT